MWAMNLLFSYVLKVIILISVFLFFFKVGLYKQAVLKTLQSTQISLQTYNSTSGAQNSEVLKHLQDLTAVPLLGILYEQQRIFQLFRLQRHQDILQLLNKILESPFRKKSFKLWHWKAITEIQLNLLVQAEQSLTKMSMYAKKRYQNALVNHLGDLLGKSREIQNIKKTIAPQEGLEWDIKRLQQYLSEKDQKERENF